MKFLSFIFVLTLASCFDSNSKKTNQEQASPSISNISSSVSESAIIVAGTTASENMIDAVTNGNITVVEQLIKSGESPDSRCEGYFRGGREKDSNDVTNKNWSLLMLAAYKNQLPVMKLLLSENADINSTNAAGHSALFLSCANSHFDAAKLLIEHDADVNLGVDENGTSTLHWAISYGWEELALEMIKRGANVNTSCSETGRSILLSALYEKDFSSDLINKIIDNGADIHKPTSDDYRTPLMYACWRNDITLVKRMVEMGADINFESKSSDTALCYAAISDTCNSELLDFLIKKGAKVNIENRKGRSSLCEAVYSRCIDKVKFLVEHGADVNRVSESYGGVFPLYEAVFAQNYDIVEYLINNGANVSLKSSEGKTVLLNAIFNNDKSYDIVKLLIDNGADINEYDDDKRTPLMKATSYNAYDIALLLINSGAKKEGRNVYGKTARMLAEEAAKRTGDKRILTLFE